MASVKLTSEQESQLLRATCALDDPQAFTRAVRQRLEAEPEIGEGLIFRVCRAAQHELFRPPPDSSTHGTHQPQPLRKFR